MKYFLIISLCCVVAVSCSSPDTAPDSSFPLKDYVMAGDEAFSYAVLDSVIGENFKEYKVKMVSGTWLTEAEVEPAEWWHWVNIIIPDQVRENEAMMIIGGGDASDPGSLPSEDWLIQAAVATGSIIAHVSNIPFQPTDFKGDQKEGRYEDDLIAFGWRQYLESGASETHLEWLARFPMTRAVVRAMDVVQEISIAEQKLVEGFFVAGASKRGWTTWTTAAVDDRVIGMAPIVIDLLNIVPSFEHHWRCYGEWSPAVEEYVVEGIMDWMGSKEFNSLLETVGPYSFINELTMPKLLINGTCDEFFVTDSWKFYWDDLKDDKYLLYVPNANHGLQGTYQPASLVSFYNAVITETPIPEYSWSVSDDTIHMKVDPGTDYRINKWEAVNETDRDFRIYVIGEVWQKEEINKQDDGEYVIHFTQPESGFKAGLVEVVFNPDTDFPLYFTSGTLVTPDVYPFEPFQPAKPR
ncbi:MAG: hypothetical protein KAT15_32065 [Bacteroidales bacterium]|nr:hypothetical protein [Bacteroidales bacterium]